MDIAIISDKHASRFAFYHDPTIYRQTGPTFIAITSPSLPLGVAGHVQYERCHSMRQMRANFGRLCERLPFSSGNKCYSIDRNEHHLSTLKLLRSQQ